MAAGSVTTARTVMRPPHDFTSTSNVSRNGLMDRDAIGQADPVIASIAIASASGAEMVASDRPSGSAGRPMVASASWPSHASDRPNDPRPKPS
jgi:hypothetical protein